MGNCRYGSFSASFCSGSFFQNFGFIANAFKAEPI